MQHEVHRVRHLDKHLGLGADIQTDVDRGVEGLGLLDLDVAPHRVVVADVD